MTFDDEFEKLAADGPPQSPRAWDLFVSPDESADKEQHVADMFACMTELEVPMPQNLAEQYWAGTTPDIHTIYYQGHAAGNYLSFLHALISVEDAISFSQYSGGNVAKPDPLAAEARNTAIATILDLPDDYYVGWGKDAFIHFTNTYLSDYVPPLNLSNPEDRTAFMDLARLEAEAREQKDQKMKAFRGDIERHVITQYGEHDSTSRVVDKIYFLGNALAASVDSIQFKEGITDTDAVIAYFLPYTLELGARDKPTDTYSQTVYEDLPVMVLTTALRFLAIKRGEV